jgi:hypothetical protein
MSKKELPDLRKAVNKVSDMDTLVALRGIVSNLEDLWTELRQLQLDLKK